MSNKGNIKNRIGEKYITNQGYEVEIIKCISSRNYTIKFIKTGLILNNIQFGHIQDGSVRNPYHPTVCNIGYNGEGKFKSKINRKATKEYNIWQSIINRCYNENIRCKFPTYKDVDICEEWCNFQIFGIWYEENYKEGFDLDKDILFKGNKIYSPETCCFVPEEVNSLFVKNDANRGDLPIGVYRTSDGRYCAQTGRGTIDRYLGTFDTIEKAFQAYKIAKEAYIKEIANKWRGQITEKCYWAMINYIVEITD